MRLQDKVIVITGAGSGLGREGALLFAAEGGRIVVSDILASRARAVAKEIESSGGDSMAVTCDVRSEDDIARLVATTVEAYGRVDVAWANAGIPEPGFGAQSFTESRLEDWNDIVAVNMTGVYLTWREAARQMIAQKGGTLLATTSAASFAAYPGFPMYASSKAGANGLVRAASLELGKHGIRVNALAPVHGMSINFAMSPDAEVLGTSYEESRPWDPDVRAMPLRLDRPPSLRDNANVALFLASDDSAYMSGQIIGSTDGGTLARVAIAFPADVGGDDAASASVLPDDLHDHVNGGNN